MMGIGSSPSGDKKEEFQRTRENKRLFELRRKSSVSRADQVTGVSAECW